MSKDEALAILKANQGVVLTYTNEWTDDQQQLTRYVHPYVLGTTKRGNLALRVFQMAGASHTDSYGWKLILLKNIGDWTLKGELPVNAPVGYRATGDDDLAVIYQVPNPLTQIIDKPTSSAPSNEVATGSILYPLLQWWRKRKQNKKVEKKD